MRHARNPTSFMKRTTSALRTAAIAFAAVAAVAAAAAADWTAYHTCEDSRSEVLITGTSTLHPWTVRGRSIEGTVRFGEEFSLDALAAGEMRGGNAEEALPVEGELAVPAKTLRSFRDNRPYSDRMDRIMLEHLQAEEHPRIEFELVRLKRAEPEEDGTPVFVAEGDLTVAGATERVLVPVALSRVDDDRLRLSGEVEMKMTDFEIDPPRALGGMIRTGDEIEVSVDWIVVREN